MKGVVTSVRTEYERYRAIGEATISQVGEGALCRRPPGGGNSIATLVWHLSENLASRFTDFLAADGEKPWRDREGEFAERDVSRSEIVAKWNDGWTVLFGALDELNDEDLGRSVTIRGVSLTVAEALCRSLAHASYHVGQIVYRGRMAVADDWSYLSIPPGGSAAYNENPRLEKPEDHAAEMGREPG